MPRVGSEFGSRLQDSLGARSAASVARAVGIAPQTLDGYLKGGMASADRALALADELEVAPRWLISGEGPRRRTGLIAVDDVEWITVPQLDLSGFTPEAKPEPMATVPLRRDWLSRSVVPSSRLWLTTMPPASLDDGPAEGDTILCQDVVAPEGEGLYLWFMDGMPLVRRLRVDPFTPAGVSAPGRAWQVPPEEGGPRLVARILGSIKLWGV